MRHFEAVIATAAAAAAAGAVDASDAYNSVDAGIIQYRDAAGTN